MNDQFPQRATNILFKLFGQLPRNGSFAVRAEQLGKLGQRFDQTVGRFIKNHRPLLIGELLQPPRTPLFRGQETFETEPVAGETAVDQRRDKSRRTGKSFHFDAMFETGAHQQEPGIGNSRRPRIRHQRHRLTGGNRRSNGFDRYMFVEFVMAPELLVQPQMLQQHLRSAGIFGQHDIGRR